MGKPTNLARRPDPQEMAKMKLGKSKLKRFMRIDFEAGVPSHLQNRLAGHEVKVLRNGLWMNFDGMVLSIVDEDIDKFLNFSPPTAINSRGRLSTTFTAEEHKLWTGKYRAAGREETPYTHMSKQGFRFFTKFVTERIGLKKRSTASNVDLARSLNLFMGTLHPRVAFMKALCSALDRYNGLRVNTNPMIVVAYLVAKSVSSKMCGTLLGRNLDSATESSSERFHAVYVRTRVRSTHVKKSDDDPEQLGIHELDRDINFPSLEESISDEEDVLGKKEEMFADDTAEQEQFLEKWENDGQVGLEEQLAQKWAKEDEVGCEKELPEEWEPEEWEIEQEQGGGEGEGEKVSSSRNAKDQRVVEEKVTEAPQDLSNSNRPGDEDLELSLVGNADCFEISKVKFESTSTRKRSRNDSAESGLALEDENLQQKPSESTRNTDSAFHGTVAGDVYRTRKEQRAAASGTRGQVLLHTDHDLGQAMPDKIGDLERRIAVPHPGFNEGNTEHIIFENADECPRLARDWYCPRRFVADC